jgi:hypothetical protein
VHDSLRFSPRSVAVSFDSEMFVPDYREAVSRSPPLKPRLGLRWNRAGWYGPSRFVGGIALIVISALG